MDDRRQALLITHEEAGCRPIVSALKTFGLRARTAPSWETARTRWQHENYDIVFLDEDLVPHCLATCLAALHSQLPPGQVVVVADAPDMGDWVEYLNAGAIDLIPKRATPFQVRHALDLAFSLDQPIENCG